MPLTKTNPLGQGGQAGEQECLLHSALEDYVHLGTMYISLNKLTFKRDIHNMYAKRKVIKTHHKKIT